MSTSPCDACIAGCCRGYHIVITGRDAYRLSTNLQLPVADFCELRWVEAPEDEYRILLSGLPGAEPRHHRLVLRRVPERTETTDQRCMFLLTVGDRGRCGVYPFRPDVCRTYPTSLSDGLVGLDGGGKYCPTGAWQVAGIDVPTFRLRHHRRRRQNMVWHALIDGWNQRLKHDGEAVGANYFFRFLMNAYRDLADRAPSLLDDDNPAPPEPSDELTAISDQALRGIGWRIDSDSDSDGDGDGDGALSDDAPA